MAKHQYPPRGYRQAEYPLPHNFGFNFALSAEAATKDSTIVTLFHTREDAASAESIEVNPRNANFAEDGGAVIHNGSIIPKLNLTFSMRLTKIAEATDGIRALKVNWMPIYISFLNSLEAEDAKTAVQVEDILELQHAVDNKDTYPLNSSTKLDETGSISASTIPLTEVFGDLGLTTNLIPESVAFDKSLFYNALEYYTNQGMLKKVIGKMNTVVVTRDRPFLYHSNNFTYPSVKRGNPYTFCGILFNLPQAADYDQIVQASEVTAISHVQIAGNVRFSEWNATFDQSM